MARGRRRKQGKKKAGVDETKMLSERIQLEAPAPGTVPGAKKKKDSKGQSTDPGAAPTLATASRFDQLPLSAATLKGLKAAQYTEMTAIQRAAIPHALAGRDILGAAKTGSGKTLAFTVPLLECLYRSDWDLHAGLGGVILSPTRELALQIFDVVRKVGRYHEMSAGLVIGGKDVREEQSRITGMNVLVCTPGRLLHHLDQTAGFMVDTVQMLVLDEADRCLDMGFRNDINAILSHLPTERQTLLFSATLPKNVRDLARLSLENPEWLAVHQDAKSATPDKLAQSYVVCGLEHKMSLLWGFIKTHLKQRSIIFMSCCKQVRFVDAVFRRMRPGVSVFCLHGKQKQMKRLATFYKFCDTPAAVLIATDIAARGLDFPTVDWVVQADCPEDVPTYIHRAGRTARLSATGKALLVLAPSEVHMVKLLTDARMPLQRISANPERTQDITPALQEILTQDNKLKLQGQQALSSYIRAYQLQKNKQVFQLQNVPVAEFALSLGLPSAPEVLTGGNKSATKRKKVDLAEEESDEEELMTIQRRDHAIDEEEEEEEEEEKEAKKPKKQKIDSLGRSKVSTAQKVVFDDEGTQMSAFEKIAQGSRNATTLKASERQALVKAKMAKADEEDRAVEKQRLKEKKRMMKNKLKGRMEEEEDIPEMEGYEDEGEEVDSDSDEHDVEEDFGSESD